MTPAGAATVTPIVAAATEGPGGAKPPTPSLVRVQTPAFTSARNIRDTRVGGAKRDTAAEATETPRALQGGVTVNRAFFREKANRAPKQTGGLLQPTIQAA